MIAGAALLILLCGVAIGATSIGGVLVVPVLTALADVPARQAVAAASFAFAFTGVAAFAGRQPQAGGSLALDVSALGGAALGALTLAWIPAEGVRWTVGLLAVASGLWALFGRPRDGAAALRASALVVLGAAVGCVSAWSGTGGPVVLLPLAALLGWHGGSAVHAAQRIQLPVALAASAVNFAAGRLDLGLGCAVGVVVLIGWGAGRWAARRMPVRRLQQAVAVALVAAGLSYL
ncbi:MAG: TSUP family transporter [Caldimonas sp.]